MSLLNRLNTVFTCIFYSHKLFHICTLNRIATIALVQFDETLCVDNLDLVLMKARRVHHQSDVITGLTCVFF